MEKENECSKLREELIRVQEKTDILQSNNQQLEAKYNEDQQKWSKLCDRVGNQMDDHKYAYSNKFPIDPFKRDNVFKESNHLM